MPASHIRSGSRVLTPRAAVTFLERAKGAAPARPHPDREDLPPLVRASWIGPPARAPQLLTTAPCQLAEALLTLANLTADENAREELYARAQTEGGAALELELDPPSTALPAAISSIIPAAAKAERPPPSPIPVTISGIVSAAMKAERPPTASIEASPSFMFATGLRSSFSYGCVKREPS